MSERLSNTVIHQRGRKFVWHLVSLFEEEGHQVSYVEPGRKGQFGLVVNGTKVPLQFEEETHSHHGGFHWTHTGKLKLGIDWLWLGKRREMKRKFFQQSPKREPWGFDVPKVVAHIKTWVETHDTVAAALEEKERIETQWDLVLERLKKRYPQSCKKLKLKATARGIQVVGVLGEKDAEAVLAQLAFLTEKA